MTLRIHINGKEYVVKETVRIVKKTFEMQKKFMNLDQDVSKSQSEDATNEDILSAVNANIEGIDEMANYIADCIDDPEVTTDFLLDNLSYDTFGKLVNKLITKILHVDNEEKKPESKSAQQNQ
ncbi:phage tail tube assembly chaperone [Sporolactobacillus sp. CQH2019]|uniref:phage tail assembly chaperone G n=1 Tax=Sporolactobacillus sp. CQH2019 TaxID=3023512 RepID=UPI002367F97E|nr:phage tail tube assembly chaperone [Sporolactobacillus sp. CQH2019]MDD9149338.1 phage tail tube assembly chaperone [Sporolactobacillus sp. CQH2019]